MSDLKQHKREFEWIQDEAMMFRNRTVMTDNVIKLITDTLDESQELINHLARYHRKKAGRLLVANIREFMTTLKQVRIKFAIPFMG
jgi:hypothetical protein